MLIFHFFHIFKNFVNCVWWGVPVRDYCYEPCLLGLGIDRTSTTYTSCPVHFFVVLDARASFVNLCYRVLSMELERITPLR